MDINPLARIGPVLPMDMKPELQQDAVTRQLVSAVQALNKSELFARDRELQFTRDRDTHRVIIKIRNPETGETIDQIPPETVLRMLADLPSSQKKVASEL